MDDERQARSAARAYLEQRQPVSEKLYAGEVLSSCRSFAWVKLQDELDNEVPEAVLEQLRDMTAGVKRKAAARKRPIEAEYVVYVSCLDLLEPQILRPGAKVALKLYTDTKGVGGYDVQVTEQAEARPEEVSELRPSEEKENVASSRPRYMRFFENKVAEEERQLLEGSYEGEVVRRAKTYAWIRPLSEMPEEVAPKIQEMCDRFRQKAEEMGGKPFCGGTEENVVYVANPDLSNKGTILSVGMKVSFKLYLDNKGVGAYEVVPSEEHIEKMLELIRKNFETEEGRAKSLPLAEVFGADDLFKDVLWVGECTHAFSLAAGRLVGVVPYAGADEHPFTLGSVWCSTELQWPRTLEKKLELDLVDNLKLLRKHGVWCSDGINALQLKESLERAKCPNVSQGFDTVFWMMPYVPDGQSRPATSIAIMMHNYIQNYLESAAKVCKVNGQLVVVVTSAQCLNWNLYKCKPTVNDEDVTPQVRWFDVGPFERHGYQSRFGDGRDRYVEQPVFHRLCDTVAVIWRMDHGSLDPGVTEEEILARKKLLEEVGTDRPEKEAESENV